MARNESDREDLMAEAVAMTRRIEVTLPDESTLIVTGFRSNGWLSIYLGPDLMYQFDEHGRLRRAFVGGLLFRTQGATLAQLHRQRTDTETTLLRRDLTETELAAFRRTMLDQLTEFHQRLIQRAVRVTRRFPVEDDQLWNDLVHGWQRVLTAPEFLAPALPRKA